MNNRINIFVAFCCIVSIIVAMSGCNKVVSDEVDNSLKTEPVVETEDFNETTESLETIVTEPRVTEVEEAVIAIIETSESVEITTSAETQHVTSTSCPTVVVITTEPVPTQSSMYACDMCNRSFVRETDLMNHLEVVHGYGGGESTPAPTLTPIPTPTSVPTPTPLPMRLYAMANVTYTVDSWTEERGSWQDVVTYNIEVVQNNGENYIGQWAVSYDGGETVANNLNRDFPYCYHYSNGYDITLTTEPYTK